MADPGTLTRLLEKLAAAPEGESAAWLREPRPGDVLDRFEVIRELGRGGFGVVYEALDRELGRRVALKTLRPGRARDRWSDAQVKAEAQATASLSHPGIVTLLEACTCDRGPYLVMELLTGETLEERLGRGPLPLAETLEVALQAARALAHVHAHGLVHRDVKPGNIFLGQDGRVKLLDLGLAHLLGRGLNTGGTPAYVAPEQWRGEQVDGRADVFALGAVLFELCTGRRAFEVKEERTSALDPGPAPRLVRPSSRGLALLVARCLEKDPGARPTAAQLAERLLEQQRRLERPRARRRLALLISTGLAAGVALALVAGKVLPGWHAPGGAGEVVVTVADFVNQTGDPELDALSGLLITSLEQSRKIKVLSRVRMVDLLIQDGEPDPRFIDERLARQVGRRAGVKAVLLPVVHRIGSFFAVELRAIDPAGGQVLFSIGERANSKDAMLDLIDRLGDRARRELHEDQQAIGADRVAVGRAVAGSLEGYQHYFAALQAMDEHDFDRSLAEAKKALEVEPTMALAHAWIAWLAWLNTAGGEDVELHIKAALATAADLPARERRFVEALGLQINGRGEKAGEALRRLAEDYPQEKLYWYLAGYGASRAEMTVLQLKSLELDPAYVWPLYHLITRGGEPAVFLPLARRAVELRPDFRATYNLALALGHAGHLEQALETARRAQAMARPPRPDVDSSVAVALVALDRLPEAAAQLEPWLRPGVNDANRHLALYPLTVVEALQGRRRAALRSFAEDQRIMGTRLAGWDAALAGIGGDEAAVRRALLAMKQPGPFEAQFFAAYGLIEQGRALVADLPADDLRRRQLDAVSEWRTGRAAEAVLHFQQVLDEAGLRDSHLAYLLGRMLADAGRCPEAIVEFDRVGRLFPWFWQKGPGLGIRMPLSLLESARCHLTLGQPNQARAKLDRLQTLWKDADSDLPALAEARSLREKLGPFPAR